MPRNVWMPWKRETRTNVPVEPIAHVTTAAGQVAHLSLELDPMYPSLHVVAGAQHLRVGLVTMVSSLLGAQAREDDLWEPLAYTGDSPSGDQLWGNRQLSATRREHPDGYLILSYHWRDRAPIRDWRVGQRVKNEMAGTDWEGVELYPAEARLMDEANEYWLFAFPPTHPAHASFGSIGHSERTVLTQAEGDAQYPAGEPTAVQRDDDGTVLR
jgi:hypothetical protein